MTTYGEIGASFKGTYAEIAARLKAQRAAEPQGVCGRTYPTLTDPPGFPYPVVTDPAVPPGVVAIVTPEYPAFPPGIVGIPHKSHYVVDDLAVCQRHGLDEAGHRYVCNRDHVHDTPKEARACDRLDLLTESRAEAAYRLGLDTENAPDSTV